MTGKIVFLTEVPAYNQAKLFESAPDVMAAVEAAELLGTSVATVRREIARGNLESIHVGRCVRITKNALLRYVGEGADHE